MDSSTGAAAAACTCTAVRLPSALVVPHSKYHRVSSPPVSSRPRIRDESLPISPTLSVVTTGLNPTSTVCSGAKRPPRRAASIACTVQ